MDEKLWEQIKKASEDSLKNPGENKKPLPKDKIGTNDNFIIVFRHGETEDNANRIFSGWRDAKLTPKGIEGAKKLSSKMNKLKIDLCPFPFPKLLLKLPYNRCSKKHS